MLLLGMKSLPLKEVGAKHLDRVGFLLDSYDLFIINLVTPVWLFE